MFHSLNRWLGFPQRVFVESKFAYENLINTFEGERPCFISVARFKNKHEQYLRYFPFDLDSKLNWKIPYKEAKKLLTFFDKHQLPHHIVISGGKGFHFYFDFKEVKVTEEVQNKIYSIQLSLQEHYKLQATDNPLFGKRVLMIRMPATKYVSIRKKNKKRYLYSNDNYCRYILDSQFRKGINHINKLAKSPGRSPLYPKHVPSLDEIIDVIPDFTYREKSNGNLDLDLEPCGTLTPTIESVGLPCLQKICKRKVPTHTERIELVSWLKLQGYRDMSILTFIKQLYKKGYWINFNQKESVNNIMSIKPRLPSCTTLKPKHENLCNTCSFRRKSK